MGWDAVVAVWPVVAVWTVVVECAVVVAECPAVVVVWPAPVVAVVRPDDPPELDPPELDDPELDGVVAEGATVAPGAPPDGAEAMSGPARITTSTPLRSEAATGGGLGMGWTLAADRLSTVAICWASGANPGW